MIVSETSDKKFNTIFIKKESAYPKCKLIEGTIVRSSFRTKNTYNVYSFESFSESEREYFIENYDRDNPIPFNLFCHFNDLPCVQPLRITSAVIVKVWGTILSYPLPVVRRFKYFKGTGRKRYLSRSDTD